MGQTDIALNLAKTGHAEQAADFETINCPDTAAATAEICSAEPAADCGTIGHPDMINDMAEITGTDSPTEIVHISWRMSGTHCATHFTGISSPHMTSARQLPDALASTASASRDACVHGVNAWLSQLCISRF